jgi:hypothetical protein
MPAQWIMNYSFHSQNIKDQGRSVDNGGLCSYSSVENKWIASTFLLVQNDSGP